MKQVSAIQTLESSNATDFMKCCAFNADGTVLATGQSNGLLMFLDYKSLTPLFDPIDHDGEVNDLDWNDQGTLCLSVSPKKCYIHDKSGKTVFSLEKPMQRSLACEFRACRFGKDAIFIAVNAKNRKKSWLAKWTRKGSTWVFERSRVAGYKPITAIELSHDEETVAIGVADLSVTFIQAKNLGFIKKFSNIHRLPITSIRFHDSDEFVATASADGTLNFIKTPMPSGSVFWAVLNMLFLLLVALVLAAYLLLMPDQQDL